MEKITKRRKSFTKGAIQRITTQNMNFPVEDFFSNCEQIRWKLEIHSHLLNKSSADKLIFCAANIVKCSEKPFCKIHMKSCNIPITHKIPIIPITPNFKKSFMFSLFVSLEN